MVKILDLFEFNHGCGLNALSRENIRNKRNTTLHGPELVRNVFPRPFGASRAITHDFSTFEYFDLTRNKRRVTRYHMKVAHFAGLGDYDVKFHHPRNVRPLRRFRIN